MPDSSTRVFLVKDDLSAPKPSEEALVAADAGEFRVRSVPRLSDALVRLRHNAFAVILLDLALPGGRGLEVLEQVRAVAQNTGVLILSSAGDEELARQAVQRGAPDYIVTSRFSGHWLARVLRYMVDRKASGDALRVSEARLRAVGDTLAVGIVVSDPKGRCVYTNAAYRTLSGLTFAQTLNADWPRRFTRRIPAAYFRNGEIRRAVPIQFSPSTAFCEMTAASYGHASTELPCSTVASCAVMSTPSMTSPPGDRRKPGHMPPKRR